MEDTFCLSNVAPQVTVWLSAADEAPGATRDLLFLPEPPPEPEDLEKSGEAVSLSYQTLPERLRMHRTPLPAQVSLQLPFLQQCVCVCVCV